jgi:hypothetical protein
VISRTRAGVGSPGWSTTGPGSPDAPPPSEIPSSAYDDVVSNFLDQLQDNQGGSNDAAATTE